MWWTGQQPAGGEKVRVLALAGAIQRRQRTVLTLLPLRELRPNPDQPRKHFNEEGIAELAASIRTHGLLQPIIVRRRDDTFELLAGERRMRAAQLAGLDRIPALVRDVDDPLEIALLENLQREDLSALEEAEGLAALIERHGYSHREVAEILGKSRPYVSNTLALTRLPETVKVELRRDGCSVSRELLMGVARVEEPEEAVSLWRRLSANGTSVRRFREERAGTRTSTHGAEQVVAAAARLNRALEQLPETTVPTPRMAEALRWTAELVQRCLARGDAEP